MPRTHYSCLIFTHQRASQIYALDFRALIHEFWSVMIKHLFGYSSPDPCRGFHIVPSRLFAAMNISHMSTCVNSTRSLISAICDSIRIVSQGSGLLSGGVFFQGTGIFNLDVLQKVSRLIKHNARKAVCGAFPVYAESLFQYSLLDAPVQVAET